MSEVTPYRFKAPRLMQEIYSVYLPQAVWCVHVIPVSAQLCRFDHMPPECTPVRFPSLTGVPQSPEYVCKMVSAPLLFPQSGRQFRRDGDDSPLVRLAFQQCYPVILAVMLYPPQAQDIVYSGAGFYAGVHYQFILRCQSVSDPAQTICRYVLRSQITPYMPPSQIPRVPVPASGLRSIVPSRVPPQERLSFLVFQFFEHSFRTLVYSIP